MKSRAAAKSLDFSPMVIGEGGRLGRKQSGAISCQLEIASVATPLRNDRPCSSHGTWKARLRGNCPGGREMLATLNGDAPDPAKIAHMARKESPRWRMSLGDS